MAGWLGALLSSVLNRDKGGEQSYNMTIGDSIKGPTRTFDERSGQYIDAPKYQQALPIQGGQVNQMDYGSDVQPGQIRAQNPNGGGYVDAGQAQSGGGFQNAMGTVSTIGSFIGNRQNNKKQNSPYQMQMRR